MFKIMEKMVKEMLMWKLEQDELLYEDQSGFRRGRSTTDKTLSSWKGRFLRALQ
jgi:hypothetical protein